MSNQGNVAVHGLLRLVLIVAIVALAIGALAGCQGGGADTKEARAEAVLKIIVAMSAGDQETLVSMTSGKLSEQSGSSEYDEPRSEVNVTDKKWDGTKLTATLTDKNPGSTDVIELTITPDDKTDNVEVLESGPNVEGTEAERLVVVLVSEGGAWKAKDYLIGGTTSWVDAVEEGQTQPTPPEGEWMSEDDVRPASVCKRSQASIEGAFMEKTEGGNAGIDLSSYKGGSVKDLEAGPAAIVPEPLTTMPHCPTEPTDYAYEIQTMEGKGTFISITCSNPDHRR